MRILQLVFAAFVAIVALAAAVAGAIVLGCVAILTSFKRRFASAAPGRGPATSRAARANVAREGGDVIDVVAREVSAEPVRDPVLHRS